MSRFIIGDNMSSITRKIYHLANKVVRHTHWYDSYWQGAQKFWNVNTFGLELVNLGSGAAFYAFDYSDSEIKGMNWALAPQSLVHDYNILRNYFSYLREGAIVVITICPFSCLYSKYDKHANFKYYTFLHPATILDFDDTEHTRALTIKGNPFREMPMKCIKLTTKEILQVVKHKLFPKKHKVNLKQTADDVLNGWMKQFGITDLSAPLSEQHLAEQHSRRKTLDEIIEFCKKRDLKPVIVIPPMHHTLTNQFPGAFIDNYINKFLDGINVPVYNNMCIDSLDDDCFASALFLSKKGAMHHTRILHGDLVADHHLSTIGGGKK